MEIILYNLNAEEMQKIDKLERENPEIIVKTVLAGFDSGVYTELIIAAIPALIEVIGAIIAAIIVARATKDSTKNGTDKTDVKKDNGKDSKPKKIIIKDSAGKEQEVVTVEDLHRVLKEIYGS